MKINMRTTKSLIILTVIAYTWNKIYLAPMILLSIDICYFWIMGRTLFFNSKDDADENK